MMTRQEICVAVEQSMQVRRTLGYAQSDEHVWCYLNYHLLIWGQLHLIHIVETDEETCEKIAEVTDNGV